MNTIIRWVGGAMCVVLVGLLSGCATPEVSRHGQVHLDEDVISGGVTSSDIRTVASRMCPELLSLPEIYNAGDTARIAISPMKNSSRFIIDMNIFMKRLRLDLNRYSQGQVRFFSQNNGTRTRSTILNNRQDAKVEQSLNQLADQIVNLPLIQNASEPITVSVLPILNVNMVNMNGDSFAAMLRSKVSQRSAGKVLFTMPGSKVKVDYFLTGQFIADGMKQEGIVNLVDYIGMMEDRIEKGESLSLYDDSAASVSGENSGNQLNIVNNLSGSMEPSLFRQLQTSASLRSNPNVTKRLAVMLVDAERELALFESMITVDEKLTDGTQTADFVLTGEISSVSKRQDSSQSDYLLVTMQLSYPDSNEIFWEDGYEVKRASVTGIVYQ